MKIEGAVPQAEYRTTFRLPRPDGTAWTMSLSPLPLGFHRRLHERGIAPPIPPQRVVRDSRGQAIRDSEGRALMHADEFDRDYLAGKERHQQRLAVLMIFESLRHDSQVEFESRPPESGSWESFADALCDEFEQAGWTMGDVGLVCEEIGKLSNLIDVHLRESEQTFSSSAREPGATREALRVHDPSTT